MTYTCTVCPMSCQVTVEGEAGNYTTTGNTCPRGNKFAINEHVAPKRMITTTVRVEGGLLPRIPVISSDEILKEKLKECLNVIYGLRIPAPVQDGQILVENICNTGVNIIASRPMPVA